MPDKKRRTAAQKQRAKARRERAAQASIVAGDGPAGLSDRPAERGDGHPRSAATQARSRRAASRRRRSRSVSRGAIVAVLGVVAAMVLLFVFRTQSNPAGSEPATQAALQKALHVPATTLQAVGAPSDTGWVNALPSGTSPIAVDGKPVVLYVGAEYCPYCAAERWPMVVALSRFGRFSDLGTTTSGGLPEAYPNTPTFSFHGSSYTSDYLTLSAIETQDRNGNTIASMDALQQQLFSTYNVEAITGSKSAIPFVMIGNRWAWAGSSYVPDVLKGKSFDQIAGALSDATTPIAKAIDGSANEVTAMICQITDGRPSAVCSAPFIAQAASNLP